MPEFVVIVAITCHAAEGCRAIRAARFLGDPFAMFQFELKSTNFEIILNL